jgi:hypothetical protein
MRQKHRISDKNQGMIWGVGDAAKAFGPLFDAWRRIGGDLR